MFRFVSHDSYWRFFFSICPPSLTWSVTFFFPRPCSLWFDYLFLQIQWRPPNYGNLSRCCLWADGRDDCTTAHYALSAHWPLKLSLPFCFALIHWNHSVASLVNLKPVMHTSHCCFKSRRQTRGRWVDTPSSSFTALAVNPGFSLIYFIRSTALE